jgi:hypothetical protein
MLRAGDRLEFVDLDLDEIGPFGALSVSRGKSATHESGSYGRACRVPNAMPRRCRRR